MTKLFYGGEILTMAEPLNPEALLVEDGKIKALGNLRKLSELAPEAEMHDLKGACLMPAFIDPHSHFTQCASAFLQVSLDGAGTVEEMKQRISAFIDEIRPEKGAWVTARDYDNNLFPNAENPNLSEIDSLAPGYKLVIHHKSGHMGMLNSEAMAAVGIDESVADPDGGRFGRETGKLTGYMEENAFIATIKKIPMPGLDELMGAYCKAQDMYVSHGITLIQEGMTMKMMLPFYEELLKRDLLKLDVYLYCDADSVFAFKELTKKYPGHCHVGGLKIFLDGSPQGRTAWMREPYEGGDGKYTGYGTMTDEQVIAAFRVAGENNLQLLAHCNGDGAAAQFLRCLEIAEKDYPNLKELRPVIIHGQLMGRDQLQKAHELGATVSFFIAHIRHWGDVHVKNFGMERAQYISPAASAIKAGIPITFHQDSPVLPPDMLETVQIAATRKTASGVLLGESEKLSVYDALKAVTVNAARQYFLEDERGSLEVGKVADMQCLSANPITASPEEIEKIKILSVYKEGKLV